MHERQRQEDGERREEGILALKRSLISSYTSSSPSVEHAKSSGRVIKLRLSKQHICTKNKNVYFHRAVPLTTPSPFLASALSLPCLSISHLLFHLPHQQQKDDWSREGEIRPHRITSRADLARGLPSLLKINNKISTNQKSKFNKYIKEVDWDVRGEKGRKEGRRRGWRERYIFCDQEHLCRVRQPPSVPFPVSQ